MSEMSTGLTNEEKAMLERLWIGITRQMDDEFQRVLEDLRGICDIANSYAARLPSVRVAHGLVTISLNGWYAHFTKYLEVASAHPLSTSPSYVETLTRIIKEIEEARESIKGAPAREVGQLERLSPAREGPGRPHSPANKQIIEFLTTPPMLENIELRKIAPREQSGSTGSQQPPAPVVQQDKDPLREVARIREQEQKDIMESREKMRLFELAHLKKMADNQRKADEAIREMRQKTWRR